MSDQSKKSDAVKTDDSTQQIVEKDLDKVSGGSTRSDMLNPQPLPPRRFQP